MPAVAVVGGSLGGLTAALLLRDIGCDVTVYERSRETLQARGAGSTGVDPNDPPSQNRRTDIRILGS